MDSRSVLILCFVAGTLIQVFLISRRPFPWGTATICALLSLIMFAPGKHENDYAPLSHLLYVVVCFGFMFATMARRTLLPVVRERMVWAMTLVLWFVFLLGHDLHRHSHAVQAALLAIPSLISLFSCWSNRQMSDAAQVASYIWFLCTVVLLGVWGFQFSSLALFERNHGLPWITPAEGFLGGMTFMLLVVYGSHLFLFIPIPGKHQSMKDRMKEWFEYVQLLGERFQDTQSSRKELMVLSMVLLGIFLSYYWVDWMTGGLAIGLAVNIISLWWWKGDAPEQAPIESPAPQSTARNPKHRIKNARRKGLTKLDPGRGE